MSDILQALRPNAEWSVVGDTYTTINWIDQTQTKPTKAEVSQAIIDCRSAATTRKASKLAARATVKDTTATTVARLQALILLFDLDQ